LVKKPNDLVETVVVQEMLHLLAPTLIAASKVHASARDRARWGDGFSRGRLMVPRRLDNGTLQPWRTTRLTRDLVDALAARRAAPAGAGKAVITRRG
jgi:hypothetical protein